MRELRKNDIYQQKRVLYEIKLQKEINNYIFNQIKGELNQAENENKKNRK